MCAHKCVCMHSCGGLAGVCLSVCVSVRITGSVRGGGGEHRGSGLPWKGPSWPVLTSVQRALSEVTECVSLCQALSSEGAGGV